MQACRICGSERVEPSRRFEAPRVEHCLECDGDYFTDDVATESLYAPSYFSGNEYFAYQEDENIHRVNANRKIDRLLRHGPPPRVVVEIGCAYGFFLRQVRERFPDAVCIGVDVDAEVIAAARARGGDVTYFVADDEEAFRAHVRRHRVDWLVAWDTFEHLSSADVLTSYVRTLAEPGTLCAITTLSSDGLVPRMRGIRWRQFHPPTHLLYPTRKTFERLAQIHGWTILAYETFGFVRSLRQYLVVGSRFLPQRLRGIYERVLLTRLFGTGFYLNLYDIVLFVFRSGEHSR